MRSHQTLRSPITYMGLLAMAEIGVRSLLLSWPEPLPWFSEAGEILHVLSAGFVGAWVFDLVVIERPRRTRRALVIPALKQVLHSIDRIERLVHRATEDAIDDSRDLRKALVELDWRSLDPHGWILEKGPGGYVDSGRRTTFADGISSGAGDIKARLDAIGPLLQYLDEKEFAAVHALQTSALLVHPDRYKISQSVGAGDIMDLLHLRDNLRGASTSLDDQPVRPFFQA